MEGWRGLGGHRLGVAWAGTSPRPTASTLAKSANSTQSENHRAAKLSEWRRRGFLSRCASPSQRLIARRLPQAGETPHTTPTRGRKKIRRSQCMNRRKSPRAKQDLFLPSEKIRRPRLPGWRSKRRPEQTTAPANPVPEPRTTKVEVKQKPQGKLEDRPNGEAYRRRNESEELQPYEP